MTDKPRILKLRRSAINLKDPDQAAEMVRYLMDKGVKFTLRHLHKGLQYQISVDHDATEHLLKAVAAAKSGDTE